MNTMFLADIVFEKLACLKLIGMDHSELIFRHFRHLQGVRYFFAHLFCTPDITGSSEIESHVA